MATATKIKPRALRPGSHVRIVSPASHLTPEKTARGVAMLQERGYHVSFGEHVYASHAYLAGTDAQRADDLNAAFADPEVDAIMCSRGGYGCARLLPLLDLDAAAASGKMLCGFSDVTTLHLALNRRSLVTMHTPMLITLSVDREPWVYESLWNCLEGRDPLAPMAKQPETLVGGTAEGEITGGCMCLMTDSLATADALDCAGKIVIIEDVDENPHRIDAMLTHLINSGQLGSAAGLVIGEMTGTDERADPTIGGWTWREIIRDRLAPLGRPCIIDFPFGHMKTMLSVPFGVQARLDADAGRVTLLESATA